MNSRSWLYGLIVFLAQTCNPHYNQSNLQERNYSQDEVIAIPDDAFEIEEDVAVEPPRPQEEPEPRIPIFEEDFNGGKATPEIEAYSIVEDMPRFPGCEQKAITKKDLKKCANDEMINFIYKNFNFPKEAFRNGIRGKAVIQVVIDRAGNVTNPQILRDPGGGCGAEALRIVKKMPRWIPGKQRGRPVGVRVKIPVSFEIEEITDIVEKMPKEGDPVPPPPKEEIIDIVEEMPRFPGCENQGLNKKDLIKCAETKMLKFVYGNIKYPTEARKKGIEGKVIVRYTVEKDGSVGDIKVLRDPSGAFSEEAKRVIEMMNDMPERWLPATQRGKPVKVIMTLPLSFKLENGKKKRKN